MLFCFNVKNKLLIFFFSSVSTTFDKLLESFKISFNIAFSSVFPDIGSLITERCLSIFLGLGVFPFSNYFFLILMAAREAACLLGTLGAI